MKKLWNDFKIKKTWNKKTFYDTSCDKQAGNGPSWRHISGAKKSKRTSKCPEKVISELRKRYIRTLKTLYPTFENVSSELWKRYIRTLKTLQRTWETLQLNLENVISEL